VPLVCRTIDLDVFVTAHRREWDRLDELTRHSRTLSGAEVDELVDLYQRTATHLSAVRTSAPDPVLVARLSQLVARARGVVTASGVPAYREVATFFLRHFPAAVYRARWWWLGAAAGFLAVAVALAVWVYANPDVQGSIAAPEEVRQLVQQDFASYYSSHPAGAFAFHVWTNNAWVAALAIASGALLGIPVPYLLWSNAANVGVIAGLMAAYGRLDLFFGLVLPHGLLELTAVFVAAGVGMRLGWTIVAPGDRPRGEAVAAEGRAAVGVAVGLGVVLLVSGVIEAFVTPSGLPTWARIGIGLGAWVGFLVYVFVLGRRAARAGDTGDLDAEDVGDTLPAVA
jgi:uncharacterized membrane protein SpoIIM required for sporulation